MKKLFLSFTLIASLNAFSDGISDDEYAWRLGAGSKFTTQTDILLPANTSRLLVCNNQISTRIAPDSICGVDSRNYCVLKIEPTEDLRRLSAGYEFLLEVTNHNPALPYAHSEFIFADRQAHGIKGIACDRTKFLGDVTLGVVRRNLDGFFEIEQAAPREIEN